MKGSRISYLLSQLFEDWLGLEVIKSNSSTEFEQYEGAKIAYGKSFGSKALSIPYSGSIEDQIFKAECSIFQEDLCLFPVENSSNYTFGFDLFAMVFHLLARTEEYNTQLKGDKLGRFSAMHSHAYNHEYLHKPIIDIWLRRLSDILLERYPGLQIKRLDLSFVSTIDIDYFWAYRQRSLPRHFMSIVKDFALLRMRNLKRRYQTFAGKSEDPFYTFETIRQLHEKAGIRPTYFIHVGDWGKYDRPNSWQRPAVQSAIKSLAGYARVGLHPSVKAYKDSQVLSTEKSRLESILDTSIKISRQHFLCFHLPDTYRSLIDSGIAEDHSMGYADDYGFRAGTTRSFAWYDLKAEEKTSLRVYPFVVMDTTLKHYLSLSPAEAQAIILQLQKDVAGMGGIFTILWHNSSLSEMDGWQGWTKVYKEVLQQH